MDHVFHRSSVKTKDTIEHQLARYLKVLRKKYTIFCHAAWLTLKIRVSTFVTNFDSRCKDLFVKSLCVYSLFLSNSKAYK